METECASRDGDITATRRKSWKQGGGRADRGPRGADEAGVRVRGSETIAGGGVLWLGVAKKVAEEVFF